MVKDGAVIASYHQSQGKGQFGNKWASEAGKNIAVTLVLRPAQLNASQQFILNMAMSLAVLDLIKLYAPKSEASVKWPNDVYIGTNKVCGILLENTIQGQQINHSIIGIGVNVNQVSFDSYFQNPTSLSLELGVTFDLDEMVARLCETMEKRILQLRSQQFDAIHKEYLSSLFQINETKKYKDVNGVFSGKITGVDESGKLTVATDRGVWNYGFKEIEYLL